VAIWNGATSPAEVMEKMGLSKGKVSNWSYTLRKAGVKLKKFRSGAFKTDVDALNKIATEALK